MKGHRAHLVVLSASAVALAVAVLVASASVTSYTVDSYYYLAKARSLARLEGIVPSFGGFDRKFFPGYSIVLAPFYAAFGERGYLACNLAALFALLGVTYRLGRRVGLDRERAAWGAALGCLSPALVQWAALPMSEPLAALFIAAFLDARLRAKESGRVRHALAASALYGLAAITRAEAVLLGVLFLSDLRAPDRRRLAFASGVAAAVLPALYLLSLLAHRNDGGPVSRYSNEISEHGVELWKLPGRFVYHLGAAYDLRFEHAVPKPAWIAAALARVAATVAIATAIARAFRRAFRREERAPEVRVGALLPPIVIGAAIHAFWFYQYERFACLWAPEAGLLAAWLVVRTDARFAAPVRAAAAAVLLLLPIAAARVAAVHHAELARESGFPGARALAAAIREDRRCDAGVVSYPEPELAYQTDRRVWFAGDKDLFVRSDVAPGELASFLEERGVRCLATPEEPRAWLARWGASRTDVVIEGEGPFKIVLP